MNLQPTGVLARAPGVTRRYRVEGAAVLPSMRPGKGQPESSPVLWSGDKAGELDRLAGEARAVRIDGTFVELTDGQRMRTARWTRAIGLTTAANRHHAGAAVDAEAIQRWGPGSLCPVHGRRTARAARHRQRQCPR